ncbi:MAG: tRNA (adenosine(37)-N6)-threonylcarbamoyltransferase complex ATPase subunit type 1 TsaE [Actinobacteria bacterium]|nr:tRNA (adenosine(37)-N6)-threonylcarbamoyltransferase complex ATPase subunit type 1 TsaE [Actinomycetota bacterium]
MDLLKISTSAKYTSLLGSMFAKMLEGSDVLLFSGELGAGKTTFISGIAAGLGIKENLSSPSFTILNIYKSSSRTQLAHADFYRLESIEEILNTGIEEYIYSKKTITCIEWGNKIKDYLKVNYVEIKFEYDLSGEYLRSIKFISKDPRWDKKLNKFKKTVNRCTYSV